MMNLFSKSVWIFLDAYTSKVNHEVVRLIKISIFVGGLLCVKKCFRHQICKVGVIILWIGKTSTSLSIHVNNMTDYRAHRNIGTTIQQSSSSHIQSNHPSLSPSPSPPQTYYSLSHLYLISKEIK